MGGSSGYVPPTYTGQPGYGGFWIRFLAIFIDGIIVAIPTYVIAFILGVLIGVSSAASGNQPSQTVQTTVTVYVEILSIAFSVGYFVYFWGRGSTLAMRLFNLRVVDAVNYEPIGIGRAALRYVGYFISSVVCYIGLIWAAFDSRKQGWHDKIASTVVIRT